MGIIVIASRTPIGLIDYYVVVEFAPLPDGSDVTLKRLLDQEQIRPGLIFRKT
jgi:hypothetical protein